MENMDSFTPSNSAEINQSEEHESLVRKRELLIEEMDHASETLKEFGTPDTEKLYNNFFHVYDEKFSFGDFEANYENGEMQNATIHLEGATDKFNATLEYDQIRDVWMMHSVENDEPTLVRNYTMMLAMAPPDVRKQLMIADNKDATFDDLTNFFAKRTKGFVDIKTYVSLSTDIDAIDSFGETAVLFEVSSSLDPQKDYRSLEVVHTNYDMSDDQSSSGEIDSQYKISVGRKNTTYREKNMSIDEARQHLDSLKDNKSFSTFNL